MKLGSTNAKRKPLAVVVEPVVRQLIKAYDDYLALLKMEADSMISVAFVHGWRSCFVEEGKAHRAKIEELKFALDAGLRKARPPRQIRAGMQAQRRTWR